MRTGRTKYGDGVAERGIPGHAVLLHYINLLAAAVKLDGDVIVGAGEC
jgi:hypothetical protein